MQINITQPQVIFTLIWGSILFTLEAFPLAFIEKPTLSLYIIVIFNIIIGILFSYLINYSTNDKLIRRKIYQDHTISRLKSWARFIFITWCILYVFNIIYSGGIVFLWRITGDARTYSDFGVPSVAGLTLSMRNICFVIYLTCYFERKKFKLLTIPLILSFFSVLELSRSNLLILILHGIAVWSLYVNRTSLKMVFKILFAFMLFFFVFSAFHELRGTEGNSALSDLLGVEFSNPVLEYAFWLYAYILTPINNVNSAIINNYSPSYLPFTLGVALIPTVIRPNIESNSGIPLVESSFTAVSGYGSMYSDYGIVGALVIMSIILCLAIRHYRRGQRHNLNSALIYPLYFSSIVLSVFYNYLFSSVAISYLFISSMISYDLNRFAKSRQYNFISKIERRDG